MVGARPAHAEFMQIWEEGYVSTSTSFEVMHTKSIMLLDGASLRRPDGELDRERILRFLDAAIGGLEFFRLRLQRGVLGLTPPAWVPDDEFDLARHVRFTDGVRTLASARLWDLAGHADGVMPLRHPLWRLRFTALDDGRVAVGMTFHHASFDGMSGMKLFSAMSRPSPELPDARENPFADVRPARAIELPLLAARGWLRRHDGAASAWRSYWSWKPTRRIRRLGGRILRPLRDRRSRDPGVRAAKLPPRHTDFRTIDAATAARTAAALGGTLSDLLVAATIRAYGDPGVVNLRYPVSARPVAADRPRNQVTDMQLFGTASLPLEELVPALRAQVVDRDLLAPPDVPGRQIGYATLLPWVSSPRYFCGALIEGIIPFAAGLGEDEITAGAILYNGRLSIGVTMQAHADVATVTEQLGRIMTGESSEIAATGRPV